MKHVFIVNPSAGRADAGIALVPRLIEQLAKMELDYVIEMTERPGHATDLARRYAMTREPVRFYACGGDGTLNEVMAGAYQYPEAEVACLPVGSGNDMIRNFGTKEDFLDLADLVAGSAVPIDLMQVNDRICVALASMGLDANVAANMPRYRRIPLVNGSMAYKMSIVENFVKPMGQNMTITVNGTAYTGKFLLAVVANGGYYGGGVCPAPLARADDGVLDVILVKKISRLRIAGVLGRYMKGNHFCGNVVASDLDDIVTFTRGNDIAIFPEGAVMANLDGECTRQEQMRVTCMPKAGRFVLPKKLYEAYPAKKEETAV